MGWPVTVGDSEPEAGTAVDEVGFADGGVAGPDGGVVGSRSFGRLLAGVVMLSPGLGLRRPVAVPARLFGGSLAAAAGAVGGVAQQSSLPVRFVSPTPHPASRD